MEARPAFLFRLRWLIILWAIFNSYDHYKSLAGADRLPWAEIIKSGETLDIVLDALLIFSAIMFSRINWLRWYCIAYFATVLTFWTMIYAAVLGFQITLSGNKAFFQPEMVANTGKLVFLFFILIALLLTTRFPRSIKWVRDG